MIKHRVLHTEMIKHRVLQDSYKTGSIFIFHSVSDFAEKGTDSTSQGSGLLGGTTGQY